MGEIIGIVVFCVLVIGAAAWLLNRPECEKDPREDQEQMEYLEAWKNLECGQGCAGGFERVAPGIGRDQNERPDNRKRTQVGR